MKILIFLHGTIIMHRHGATVTREERVQQVVQDEKSVRDYASYIPIDNSVDKITKWKNQGAEIIYFSSHATEDVEKDIIVLDKFDFPKGQVFNRQNNEDYANVVERIMPDVLIEDDCESIGGLTEMIYPNLESGLKNKIKSIVVKEFEGIDQLPDDLSELMNYQ